MKSYTDLEQSRKLTEILHLESADMYYEPLDGFRTEPSEPMIGDIKYAHPRSIPCWSLAALLSVIPNYKLSSEHNYHTCIAETSFGKETVAWFDNPVDACYEMILKLYDEETLH